MELNLFFSWQMETDLQGFNNKRFLIDCIQRAIKKVENKKDLEGVSIKFTEGLRGTAGNAKVADEMFRKIDECDIFIGDVTTAQRMHERGEILRNKKCLYFRYSPNCNVYGEYNRALGKNETFWKQIILLMNKANKTVFDDPCIMPFDTRDRRWPIDFTLPDDSKENKEKAKAELVEVLADAIHRSALDALHSRNNKYHPFVSWNTQERDGRIQSCGIDPAILNKHKASIIGSSENVCVVGTSGYEKARLVHDAFDEDFSRNNYLYLDCYENDFSECKTILNQVFDKAKDLILVIDNISEDDIKKALNIKRKCNAHNKIIFCVSGILQQVESEQINLSRVDIINDISNAIDFVFGEANVRSIEHKERIKNICDNRIELITEVVRNAEASNDLSRFSDENIVTNIIGAKIGEFDRTIMQALALFESVGWSNERSGELDFVLSNKSIAPIDMEGKVLLSTARSLIKRNIKKGLIVERGRTISVVPSGLAIQLASEWIEGADETRLVQMLADIKTSPFGGILIDEFHDRFRYLGKSEAAKDIVGKLLKVGSVFENASVYNSNEGAKIIESLAQVNPNSVVDLLERIINTKTSDELKTVDDGRRYLVWALEKLCYREETFSRSAKLMLRLANAENETISNNATGVFVSFFPILLPATAASLNMRLSFLQENYPSPENRSIVLSALKRALTTRDFILFRGTEQMGDSKVEPYRPTDNEVDIYLEKCLEMVISDVDTDSDFLEKRLDILESCVISICDFGRGSIILPSIISVSEQLDGNWDKMQHTLAFFKQRVWNQLDTNEKELYSKALSILTKDDVLSRFKRIESESYYIGERSDFQKRIETQREKYSSLANEVIDKKLLTFELLKGLITQDNISSNPFGKVLAERMGKEERSDFIVDYVSALNATEKGRIDILCDFVSVIEFEEFSESIPILQNAKVSYTLFALMGLKGVKPTDGQFALLQRRIEEGKSTAEDYMQYWSRIRLDQLDEDFLLSLFDVILSADGGFAVMMKIVSFLALDKQLPSFPRMLDYLSTAIVEYHGQVSLFKIPCAIHVISNLLAIRQYELLAKKISEEIIALIKDDLYFGHNYEIDECNRILMSRYFEVVWPSFGDLMMSDNLSYSTFSNIKSMIGIDIVDETTPIIIEGDHYDQILSWCESHKEKGPIFIAGLIPVSDGSQFSKYALSLIDKFGEVPGVLEELSCNLNSFSSVGSVVPYYENRKAIYSTMLSNKSEAVRIWAQKNVDECNYMIEYEGLREQE